MMDQNPNTKISCSSNTRAENMDIPLPSGYNRDHSIFYTFFEGRTTAFGCGDNSFGQLGGEYEAKVGELREIREIRGIPIKQVACGRRYTIFVCADGRLLSVGMNRDGQLGRGDMGNCDIDRCNIPGEVLFPEDDVQIEKVAAGQNHVLACDSEGRVWAWGVNSDSQCGVQDVRKMYKPILVDVPACIDIAAGFCHSGAITQEGEVIVWGRRGSLGAGSPYESNARTLSFPEKYGVPIRILSGGNHLLILTDRGKVMGWGSSNDYQFKEDGNIGIVELNERIVGISCGSYFNLGWNAKGTAWFWGRLASFTQQKPTKIECEPIVRASCGYNRFSMLTRSGKLLTKNIFSVQSYGSNVLQVRETKLPDGVALNGSWSADKVPSLLFLASQSCVIHEARTDGLPPVLRALLMNRFGYVMKSESHSRWHL